MSTIPFHQPVRRLQVVLQLQGRIDLPSLDRWLQEAVELATPARSAPEAAAEGLVARCLMLANALMHAAGAPVFDPPEVLEVQPINDGAPGRWRVTAGMPDVEGLDAASHGQALGSAALLVRRMMRQPCTPEAVADMQAHLQREIRQLRRGLPAGKSTVPLLREAWRAGIPFVHLGHGAYQLGWGSRAVRIERSTTGRDSAIGSRLTHNKRWATGLMRAAGLPAPVHVAVRALDEAIAAAGRLGWPLVVKPAALDRGEGVSVDLASVAALEAAFVRARAAAPRGELLVERQAEGVCHRLFVARGRLLYAVKRLPKSVQGDGLATVAELVARANAAERRRPPWLRAEFFPLDGEAGAAMAAAGFAPDAVPPAGALVPLRRIESTAAGGFDIDETARVHPDNIDVALRAARLFGLDVAGVDLIATDISRPWHETGAIVNEVNFAPLLGGGEISRSYVPEYLRRIVDGDGRIPVEAVVGEDAGLAFARQRQQAMLAEGLRCFVTSQDETFDDRGASVWMPFDGLARRCRALLLDERVDALVLSASAAEWLEGALPVDRLAGVHQLAGGPVALPARAPTAERGLIPTQAPIPTQALAASQATTTGPGRNLADCLLEHARERPDAIALETHQGAHQGAHQEALTWRRCDALVWRAAMHLRRSGVARGDVVALSFAGEAALLVATLAVARMGATLLSLPAHYPLLQRQEMVREAGARILVSDRASGDAVDLPRIPFDLSSLLASESPIDRSVRDPEPSAPWAIAIGSGSTGRSKLLPSAHAQARDRAPRLCAATAEDRVVSLTSLDFTSARMIAMAALMAGATLVLGDRRVRDLAEMCRAAAPTIVWASVFHLETMLQRLRDDAGPGEPPEILLPSVRMLLVGGSIVTESLRRRVMRLLTPELYIVYGTNEVGTVSVATPDQIRSTPGTVGKVQPGIDFEIVDAQGAPVPEGEIGRLRLRTPGQISGYRGDEAATRKAFVGGGWFLPGDLAQLTPDGQLVHCGRADDLIIMNGINIHPAEIEHVLAAHPAVRDVAVIALPTRIQQQVPMCAVALREGAAATESELREYARQRLGARAPYAVIVMDSIPRNELGKPVREALRREMAARLEAAR